ncbi:hypothetical protein [uncultured Chryseobacterium sp.]|uniref:hypothetical protein n=1 Tax=uncultured Chryseobacterium sp. TaxID=259322 RepID=UPI0025D5FC99|nr:hypothetical protein [uncultured Chryseobacterium sp.]
MKTKVIMILGMIFLWTFTSCRFDLPSDEPEDKNKGENIQQLTYLTLENDSLSLSK